MAGLDPAIQHNKESSGAHPRANWMAASRAAMTRGLVSGFVYILANRRNGTLYTGVTNDIATRVYEHRQGRGSKFVKRYGVTQLVWFEEHPMLAQAIQRETSIKRWKRAWKLELIEKTNPNWRDLYDVLI